MSRINFGAADFSAEDYVYGLCDIPDITLADIQAQQERLKRHTETNSLALRANVNKNYANFIETAKETSNILLCRGHLGACMRVRSFHLCGLALVIRCTLPFPHPVLICCCAFRSPPAVLP
eukprot:m.47752 g.47752  ORF g.47752 m.47752 type:complete len:121 (-) comp5996_c0_seq3:1923-2285(-)